jgi:hypothetical protein
MCDRVGLTAFTKTKVHVCDVKYSLRVGIKVPRLIWLKTEEAKELTSRDLLLR